MIKRRKRVTQRHMSAVNTSVLMNGGFLCFPDAVSGFIYRRDFERPLLVSQPRCKTKEVKLQEPYTPR